ncbi:flagellar hook-basal body complex protein FliE [Roseomonas alkaliterrae]|jgi:flagellar hook-basal body complex protein FliE|uniref:Flagellar hook-basal body complex protein FliE n=1 Tax=Neoroseomonas alkaliterrae TaxID=1452450 RepID=A0A840XR72_9PROT|nr:flagellar hook-basal body complex protein FliE [Neoroseomonas alkaliterrae]MBB5689179.1 flagellar hook-basal body complex protein FliE [Neoroseomonas alkaliterrae]MBR0676480.1 flagellar hook-basal body complex protein FliE [Neoroseomonas alkaliterrae]
MAIPLAPAGVAAAYRAADALPQAGSAAAGGGAGFGAALSRAMEQAVEVGRAADAATTSALTGQGSVTDVVLAVGRAELTLQTAVAVRDRVVAAYQDVMRMPI